jgi:hypothetical protein
MYRTNQTEGSTRPTRERSGPPLVGALAAPALAIALALIVTMAACGGGGSAGGSIEHPTGKGEVVLRVFSSGGFVPVSYSLTELPGFTLYGDGTVIITGPVIMIYPGPALPNLQTTTVSEEAVQAILSAAREVGLCANDVNYGQPGITDIPTTTVIVNADDTTYRSDIYALGMESGASGLSFEQQQARAAINDLVGKLADLTAFQPGEIEWTAYAYSTLAVYSEPVIPGADTADVEPNRLEWPLGDLSALGQAVQPEGYRRVDISGADLVDLQPLLEQATQITLWTSGGREYHLYFRPLLPDETI